MTNSYPLGKLPAEHLARLLGRYSPTDPDVVVGPRVGEDAAVVAVTPGRYLVAKSDPITFATDEIGWYAVHVNANDVACCGATPRWWMATVLLPAGSATAELVDTIFEQFGQACAQVGAQLVGGHTEITHGLDRTVVVGTMLGEVEPGKLVSTGGAQPGDVLVLTKGIAVEGTAIIAREKRDALEGRVPDTVLARGVAFLHDPGISVVLDAQILCLAVGSAVHAMHDPTEGGVVTGLHELAEASECGLEIREDALPILPETRAVCEPLGLDPLGLIASGSLLAAVAPGAAQEAMAALRAAGIQAAEIGRVLPSGSGRVLVQGVERRPLPVFSRDEVARLFDVMAPERVEDRENE